MKTKKTTDDGMEWLRRLRLKVAAECEYDLARQRELYRTAATNEPHRSHRRRNSMQVAKKVVHPVT